MPTLRHRLATRRLVGVALLAVLLAQWSVLTHAVWHARTGPGLAATAQRALAAPAQGGGAQATSPELAPAAPAATAGDERWGHRAGAPACQLFDQLLLGQAAGAEPPQLVSLLATDVLAAPAPATALPGASATAYDARGPPRA